MSIWLNSLRLYSAMGPSRSFRSFCPAAVMRTVMTRRSLLSRLRASRLAVLQSVEQARNIRVARDHALRHLAAAEALLPRAAQDAQNVVLGVRKPRQLQDLLHSAGQRIRGAHQVQEHLGFQALKRLALLDFVLELRLT